MNEVLYMWYLVLGLVMAVLLQSGSVQAQSNRVEANASLGGVYDSNRMLDPNADQPVSGLREFASIQYRSLESRKDWLVGVRATEEQLSDHQDQEGDSAEAFAKSSLSGERSSIQIDGKVKQDTTLATEFLAAGNISDEKAFLQGTLNLAASANISETLRLNLGLNAENLDYQDSEKTSLDEYTYYGASTGAGLLVSELHSFELSVFASDLRNHTVESSNRTYGAKITWLAKLDQRFDIRAGLGGRKTYYEFEYPWLARAQAQEGSGRVGDFKLNYQGARYSAQVNTSYELVPNSNGYLVNRQAAGLVFSVRQSETMRVDVTGNYRQQRSEQTFQSRDDLDSTIVALIFNWRFREHWHLAGRYQYFTRELVEIDEKADSQLVGLDLVWAMHPIWQD